MKEIRAVLFDMDGLLIDSERINAECACELAAQMGFVMDPVHLARTAFGTRRENVVEAYAKLMPPGVDAEEFYRRKCEMLLARRNDQPFRAMKGAQELLQWLNEHGILCVLATSSKRIAAEENLRSAGLWEYFSGCVTGDMVANSKPHPEIYLKAAQLAGVEAGRCLVLEDAFNGIRAGRAAGAVVGMVPDILPYDEECRPYCDAVFADLAEVIPWLCGD